MLVFSMGRRQRSEQLAEDQPLGESASTIERRLALLESSKPKNAPPKDPFTEDHLEPLERIDFSARPIDPEVVRRLASIGSDDAEIAEVFDLKIEQLRLMFSEQLRNGRAQGRTSLRRKQWQVAMKGNVPMLIHLGRVVLGQNETVNHNHSGKVEVEDVTPKQQLFDLIREASIRLRGLDPADEVPMPRLASGAADDI